MWSISKRADILIVLDFTYESLSHARENSVKYGYPLSLNKYSLWDFLLNMWAIGELLCLFYSLIHVNIYRFCRHFIDKDLNVSKELPLSHELLRWVLLYNNSKWKSPFRGLLFFWLDSILEENLLHHCYNKNLALDVFVMIDMVLERFYKSNNYAPV